MIYLKTWNNSQFNRIIMMSKLQNLFYFVLSTVLQQVRELGPLNAKD